MNKQDRHPVIAAVTFIAALALSFALILLNEPAPEPDLVAVEAALERFNAANERMVKSMFELREAVLAAQEAQRELNEAKGD